MCFGYNLENIFLTSFSHFKPFERQYFQNAYIVRILCTIRLQPIYANLFLTVQTCFIVV